VRKYPHTVTFQEAVTSRTPSGQVITDDYENVDGMVSLPARVIPAVVENAGERMVTTEDMFQIIVQGDQPIRPAMVALTEDGVFDVKRVANPTLGRPLTLATIVVAERIAL
jgi:hypothetical protein